MKLANIFISVTLLIALAAALIFYFNALNIQNRYVENLALNEVNHAKSTFDNTVYADSKMLAAALEVLTQDQAFKNVYLEGNRRKLYEYGQPLFQNLKNKYGITHVYFILPNGTTFVRLHNPEIYGDEITRSTFLNARDTKKISTGLELGKTAYALRAVVPYYNGDELIGYVELGEEIEHFLQIMKEDTPHSTLGEQTGKNASAAIDNNFAIIADKKYLDRENWKSVRQVAGLRDNWNDFEEHLFISGTLKEATTCFAEENLETIEENELLIKQTESEGRTYICSGFEILDAGKQHSGTMLTLMDVTHHINLVKKTSRAILITSAGLLLFISLLAYFTSSLVSKPIKDLTNAVNEISKGNFKAKIEKTSRVDEINVLTDSLSRVLASVKLAILRTGATKQELGLGEAIKAKKEAEEKLKASERRFGSLTEASPDCIKLLDLKGELLYMSPGGLKEHRLKKPDDAVGWDYMSSIVKEHRPLVKNALEKAKKGETTTLEVKHIPEKSTRTWCLMTLAPIRDAKGKVIKVFGVSRDITEQKKTSRELSENEIKLQSLVQNTPGMIYIAKPDWSAEIISNSEPICGYSIEEFRDKKVNWLNLIDLKDKKRVFKEGSLLTKKPTKIVQTYRIKAKDKTIRWVEDHKVSVFSKGKLAGIYGIVYDVTERLKKRENV